MKCPDLSKTIYSQSTIIKKKLEEAYELKRQKYNKIIPEKLLLSKVKNQKSKNIKKIIKSHSTNYLFKTSLTSNLNTKEEKKFEKMKNIKDLKRTSYQNEEKSCLPKPFPIINRMKHPRYKLIKPNEPINPKQYLKYFFKPLVQYNRILCGKNGSKAYEEVSVEKLFPTNLIKRNNFSQKFRTTRNDFPSLFEAKWNIPIKEEEEINKIKYQNLEEERRRKEILAKFKEKIIKCMLEYKRRKFLIKDNVLPCSIEEYESIIHELIYNENYEYVKMKIINNPSLCLYKDDFKQTILHICSKKNFYKILPVLIKYGSNINAKTIAGYTPIHLASKFKALEALQILLINFAIPNLKDNLGLKPKDYNNELLFELILDRACIVNFIFL